MSDQEQARHLAETQLPFLITDSEELRRIQESEPKNEAAIQWEAQLPGLFDELVPRGPSHEDDSLSQAAMIYFGATTLLSPLIEEAAAKHLAKRKEKENDQDSITFPRMGESTNPDQG